MPDRRTRILVVSAAIGGGHVAAGRALESALLERGAEVDHVDLLNYTPAPFRRIYRQAYFDLVRTAPDLVDWLGRRLDRRPSEVGSRQQRLRARLTRLLSYELPRRMDAWAPDAVLHTHFLGPEILAGRLRARRPLPPQGEVITDFFAHSLWLQPGLADYFVATEEVAVHLRSTGIAADRIHVTGIPIDLRFADLPTRADARALHGLNAERDVLLLMAGGLDAQLFRALLAQLRELRRPLSTIVVCGRSEHLVGVARGALEGYDGPVAFEVLGQTDDVPSLMAAADLLIGKPGGLTCSEALAAGLPLAVVKPYPLQEEANANVLLERGAAMRIEPLSTFSHKIRLYLEDAERRHDMRAAALRLARPGAARSVARIALERLVPGGSRGSAAEGRPGAEEDA